MPGADQRGRQVSSGNKGRCTPIHKGIIIGLLKSGCTRQFESIRVNIGYAVLAIPQTGFVFLVRVPGYALGSSSWTELS